MLYPGWVRDQTSRDVVEIDAIVDHIDHICQLAGSRDHVSVGSDLDGGFGTEQTPRGLDSIADLLAILINTAEIIARDRNPGGAIDDIIWSVG